MLEGGCKLRLGCLAVVSSLAGSSGGTPLLEVALTEVEADLKRELGHRVEGVLRGAMRCSVFSNTRLGWEPVVERWSFGLQLDRMSEE